MEGTLVRLRAMEPEDLEDALKWVNDREVTLWLTSLRYPMARKDEQKWFDDAPTNSFASLAVFTSPLFKDSTGFLSSVATVIDHPRFLYSFCF